MNNDGYPSSLEVRKIYQTIPDVAARRHKQVRVIDESGEDYLYPADMFVPIALPDAAQEAFRAAS